MIGVLAGSHLVVRANDKGDSTFCSARYVRPSTSHNALALGVCSPLHARFARLLHWSLPGASSKQQSFMGSRLGPKLPPLNVPDKKIPRARRFFIKGITAITPSF